MAKALIGYLGGPTSEQLRATAALHRRIADLESEIMRLKVENDGLLRTIRERVDHVTAGDLMESAAH
jgi:predicted deacylase